MLLVKELIKQSNMPLFVCHNSSQFLVSSLGCHWPEHCIVWFVFWLQGVASFPFITTLGISSCFGPNWFKTWPDCKGTEPNIRPRCKYNFTAQIVFDETIEKKFLGVWMEFTYYKNGLLYSAEWNVCVSGRFFQGLLDFCWC